MIESMVTATARNIGQILRGGKPSFQATWNAVCLADFGDSGIAFVAQPQIPPRNVNWSSSGKWVHAAKIGFEKYFIRKMRKGESEPFYESMALNMLGIEKLKAARPDEAVALQGRVADPSRRAARRPRPPFGWSPSPVSLSLHGGGDAAAPFLPCASARGRGTMRSMVVGVLPWA